LSCQKVHGIICSSCYIRISDGRTVLYSWLIDTDKDAEGMRVIADLHGGDPDDVLAKAEFQEIKDKVTFEVSHCLCNQRLHLRMDECSVNLVRADPML
jgi:hypothetical protein